MKFRLDVAISGLLVLIMVIFSSPTVYATSSSLRVHQQSNTGIPPIISPGTNASGSAASPLSPNSQVNVVVTHNSAVVNWSTAELTLARLAWGLTTEYDLGNIAAEQFEKNHSLLISNLKPNTKYYYRISAINVGGSITNLVGSFITLSQPDRSSPENVNQFFASSQPDRILLSWNNPADNDFNSVRIIRSDKFYPLDPLNGKLVYEGRASQFEDTDVNPGTIYYYTAFTRDYSGNYSSGALASAMIVWFSENIVDLQLPYDSDFVITPGLFNSLIITDKDGNIISNSDLVIPAGENLKIAVPESTLPNQGSFLTLTVNDEKKQSAGSTFLFSHDQNGDQYYVNTPTFKNEQVYDLVITVFNSSNLIIGKIFGTVNVVQASELSSSGKRSQADADTPWPLKHLPATAAVVVVGGGAAVLGIRYLRYLRIVQRFIDKI